MTLVDTSVWVDHLSRADRAMAELLAQGQVLSHPFVIGEISVGMLKHRENVMGLLGSLHKAVCATDEEAIRFIQDHELYGTGVGYIDAHLLIAVKLTRGADLWTRDRRMRTAAEKLLLPLRFPS